MLEVVQVLPHCKGLRFMALWGHPIGEKGCLALADVIEQMPRLVWLNVADNPFVKVSAAKEQLKKAWRRAGKRPGYLHFGSRTHPNCTSG
eukprot:UN4756